MLESRPLIEPLDQSPERRTPVAPGTASTRRIRLGLAVVLCLTFAITFLKGFRMPNAWSATQFAFNYSQGFVRRGFVGEVARTLFGDGVFKYGAFVSFAFLLMVVVTVALCWAVRRAWKGNAEELGFQCALLAFAASPGLVFFVHAVGYFDYLGFLGVLGLILSRSSRPRRYVIFYVSIGVGLIFALIHEVLAVMFGTVMLFAMLCHIVDLGRRTRLSTAVWVSLCAHLCCAILIVFVVSSLVSTLGTEDASRIAALKSWIVRHSDFPLRFEAFEALQRSSKEAFESLMPWYWATRSNRLLAWKAFFAFLPSFAFLIFYGLFSIRRMQESRLNRYMLSAVFVAASLAPLALNLVGWDFNRWNAIALLACFSCLLSMKLFLPSAPLRTTPVHVWTLGAAAIALSLASDTVLFDGFTVQHYPFENQFEFIERLFQDGTTYRPHD